MLFTATFMQGAERPSWPSSRIQTVGILHRKDCPTSRLSAAGCTSREATHLKHMYERLMNVTRALPYHGSYNRR